MFCVGDSVLIIENDNTINYTTTTIGMEGEVTKVFNESVVQVRFDCLEGKVYTLHVNDLEHSNTIVPDFVNELKIRNYVVQDSKPRRVLKLTKHIHLSLIHI